MEEDLTSQLKEHDSLLRLKRRILPDSLIREDIVNYGDIKKLHRMGI